MAKIYMGGKRVYVSKSNYEKYKAGQMSKEEAIGNNTQQSRADFINDIVKNYNDFDRGDLQGVVEAYAMRTGADEEQLLKEIDAKARQSNTNNKEIQAVYDYAEKRGGRYPTIGQNTKAYKYAINNATDITVHDDSDYDYYTGARFNKPATIADMKHDINRFNMKLNYVGDDTFRLSYYSGLFYTFKLKK